MDGALIEEEFEGPQTIMMRNDSVQRFDIHSEYELVSGREMNVLKDLESMFGILDIGRQVPTKGAIT